MSEQTAPVESPVTPAVDPTIKAELDQQMAISLNGGVAPAASVPAGDAPPPPPADPFGIFKEKFGYDSPEVAIQDIEALRAFRAAPPVAELKFENETSKRVADALQAGNLKEVYEVLDQQMRIDRLTSGEMTVDSATELVKYGMQIKYKELTPAEINYKFNKQFALPPKPGLLPTEDQDEFNARVTAWEAQVEDKKTELLIEAKLAKPDLLASKSKLVFPAIARPQDTEFQEWQNTVQENERQAGETAQAYKAFTPKSVETKMHFKDEANKIDFDFIHEPDPESFKETLDMVNDINLFWKRFVKPDGTPDRQGFFKAVNMMLNQDKILMNAMNQVKNATIKAMLPDNNVGGLVRQMPQTQEPNELDRLMRESLKGYGGF